MLRSSQLLTSVGRELNNAWPSPSLLLDLRDESTTALGQVPEPDCVVVLRARQGHRSGRRVLGTRVHGDARHGRCVPSHDMNDLKGGRLVEDELTVGGANEDVLISGPGAARARSNVGREAGLPDFNREVEVVQAEGAIDATREHQTRLAALVVQGLDHPDAALVVRNGEAEGERGGAGSGREVASRGQVFHLTRFRREVSRELRVL